MKIRNLVVGAAVTFAAATLLITRAADDKPAKAKEAAAPNTDEMMKKWEAYATPGAGHKALDPLVGEWKVDSKWWMAGPDGPPTASKGTCQRPPAKPEACNCEPLKAG